MPIPGPIMHLPTELLSEILQNVDECNNRTLKIVSLTCRHFYSVVKPLIFRRVDLTWAHKGDISRQRARLDFYSSGPIAPFVHELTMSGNLHGTEFEPESTNLLVKIFDVLPRFINIQSFFCWYLDFTQFALHQVSTLSSLERLVLMDCNAPPQTDSLPMLRPRIFECIADDSDDEDQLEAGHLLSLLDLNHLQVLRIPLSESLYSSFLANDNASPCLFPSLHAVHLSVDHEMVQVLPRLLSQTPTLRSLKLNRIHASPAQCIRMFEALVPPAACLVPHLEEYRGPHKLLPIVLGRATASPSLQLRRLLLENSGEVGDPLIAFMDSFQSCHPLQLRALTHLHISRLNSMDVQSLAELQDMFPVLQEFYLHATERYIPSAHLHNVDFTELNTLLLPSTLVSLSIQWTSGQNIRASDFTAAEGAKDSIISRLPYLRRLWLYDFSRLTVLWNRTGLQSEERCIVQEARFGADPWTMRRAVFPEFSFFQL